MIVIANGHVATGVFPLAGAPAYLGLVHEIWVAPDPLAVSYVSVLHAGVVLRKFNIPAPNGSNDEVLKICPGKEGIDPTLFSIAATTTDGAFVTYIIY